MSASACTTVPRPCSYHDMCVIAEAVWNTAYEEAEARGCDEDECASIADAASDGVWIEYGGER